MHDSKERYGLVTRIFHWGMGLLIIWQFMKFFDRIDDGEHWVGENLASWHVSIGTVLLVLVVLRILWAIRQKDNRPEQDPATALLVKAGHGLLYLGMVLLPVTGVLFMMGNGYGLDVFGIELIPGREKGQEIGWMQSLSRLHVPVAWSLLILVAGHAGMAMLHYFVKKDAVLQRML